MTNRRRPQSSLPGRRIVGFGFTVTTLFGLALASGVLVSPATSGGPVTPATTWSAPYHLASKLLTNSHSTGSCGTASNLRAAYFNVKTGKGGLAETASAPACTGHLAHSGWALGEFEVEVPVHASAGNHTVVVHLKGNSSASQGLTLGSCRASRSANWGCTQLTRAQVNADVGLVEMNGSRVVARWASSNAWAGLVTETYNTSTCAGSSCTYSSGGGAGGFSGNWSVALYVNASFVVGHSYLVQLDVVGSAEVLFAGYNTYLSAAHGFAALNLGTMGYGVKLTSITVS